MEVTRIGAADAVSLDDSQKLGFNRLLRAKQTKEVRAPQPIRTDGLFMFAKEHSEPDHLVKHRTKTQGVHVLEDRLPPGGANGHEFRLTAWGGRLRSENERVGQDLVPVVEVQRPVEAIANIVHDRGISLHGEEVVGCNRPDGANGILALPLLEEVIQQAVADYLDEAGVVVRLRKNSEDQASILEREAKSA